MCNISSPSNGTALTSRDAGNGTGGFRWRRVAEEQRPGPQVYPTARVIWTGRSVPMSFFVFSVSKSLNKHAHPLWAGLWQEVQS